MIRALAMTMLAVSACGRSSGVTDEQLGNLVAPPARADAKIDVDRAAREVSELGRALSARHDAALAALGPHTTVIKTSTAVDEAGKQVSELADETVLVIGEDRRSFRGVYSNSADYGRETIHVATPAGPGKLYLRPRYQRWHGRMPEHPNEPAEIRESYYGAIAATWELVGYAAEITDRGAAVVNGRAGRKIEVRLDPSPGKPPREPLAQRAWREGRSVEALTGQAILDAEHGVPLAVELDAHVAFSRDGRSFVMKVKLSSSITSFAAAPITAPLDSEVVATPGRMREVDDRDYLLQGIAPPIRKNPDGTAVAPAPKPPAAPKPSGADGKDGAK